MGHCLVVTWRGCKQVEGALRGVVWQAQSALLGVACEAASVRRVCMYVITPAYYVIVCELFGKHVSLD